ncbi:MOSC domain protein [bacterium BMS3Abin14]|nr:MOSC domain protein [bacterium BMS3Abin14]
MGLARNDFAFREDTEKGKGRGMGVAGKDMRIVAVSVSDSKGVRKENIASAILIPEHGIENDAHAGKWHRQVSLLARESIDKMVGKGLDVGPGDFAENLTTEGIELTSLPVGQRLRLGSESLVEVTQIGKVCHEHCAIYYQAGDCVMPKEGIFVRVLKGGTIKPGDGITVVDSGKTDGH